MYEPVLDRCHGLNVAAQATSFPPTYDELARERVELAAQLAFLQRQNKN
jgi:hypothetical protein